MSDLAFTHRGNPGTKVDMLRITTAQSQSAVRCVARHAKGPADAAHLLDVLGLAGVAQEMTRKDAA